MVQLVTRDYTQSTPLYSPPSVCVCVLSAHHSERHSTPSGACGRISKGHTGRDQQESVLSSFFFFRFQYSTFPLRCSPLFFTARVVEWSVSLVHREGELLVPTT